MSKIAKNKFTLEDYLFCLQNQRAQRTDDFRTTSKCQQIFSNNIRKKHYLDLWIKDMFLIVESIPCRFLAIIVVGAMKLNATDISDCYIRHKLYCFLCCIENRFTMFQSKTVLWCFLVILFFLSGFFCLFNSLLVLTEGCSVLWHLSTKDALLSEVEKISLMLWFSQ